MDFLNPVYSLDTQCQDCYKCIRECPVKAIRVVSGHAKVVSEQCIACGHCVSVCPSGAKQVRDDLRRAQHLLNRKEKVILSIAPSFVSEFNGVSHEQLIESIKQLGFYGVSETALGAQQVSAQIAEDVDKNQKLLISSACPVAVDYILKYLPEYSQNITPILSPLLSHCRLLRSVYGEDIGIVFAGPCIAKKLEAAEHPKLLDVAITFEDLRKWFEMQNITPESTGSSSEFQFIPYKAAEGSLYPIEGGMVDATKVNCPNTKCKFMSISGMEHIEAALKNLRNDEINSGMFLELLACEGGCVNGPKSSRRSTIASRIDVTNYAEEDRNAYPRHPDVSVHTDYKIQEIKQPEYTNDEIQATLLRIGKKSVDDELDCGGCGYGSCRELAKAILSGKAETDMCVSYMRIQAQKKANAILKSLPYAAVIVDENMKIVECNKEFAHIGGEDTELINEVIPGLEGAMLPSVVPFSDLFQSVINTGEDILRKYVKFNDIVLSITVFTIEPHRFVGAILIDVTGTEMRREQIVEKAQTVIENTLSTVQEIAFKLGKNAAESECILNSIIEGFSVQSYPKDENK